MDLRSAYRKTELCKSLRTKDHREARRLGADQISAWYREFEAKRRLREPTPTDLQAAVWGHYETELDHDRQTRAHMPKQAEYDLERARFIQDVQDGKAEANDFGRIGDILMLRNPLGYEQDRRKHQRASIAKNLASGETYDVHWAADLIIEREGLAIAKASRAYIDLCQRLQRAELEALKRAAERDEGDWGGTPTDILVKPPSPSALALVAKPGESIMDLFAVFKSETKSAKLEDTWRGNEKIVELFASFLGKNAHVSAITRKAVRDWKVQLDKWPIKAAEVTEFRGLSFSEIIRKNQTLDEPKRRICDKTKNKYLSAVGSFCAWLLTNDHITTDVMTGMSIAKSKEKKVLPYNSEQLACIFSSPLFMGCARDAREYLPGVQMVRDWRYWIPLIALFTGARQGEICQLMVADVKKINEIWVFHITEEGEGDKRAKTPGSMRVVPIHSTLIDLGLLAFHASAQTGPLFPELKRDAHGQFGAVSRFFNNYFKRVGVKVDKSVNFHSLRHTISDAFRRAQLRNDDFAPLLGHVKGTTTSRYGILPEGNLANFKKMIDAVEYPGISLR